MKDLSMPATQWRAETERGHHPQWCPFSSHDHTDAVLKYAVAGGVVDVLVELTFHLVFPDRPCWRLMPALLAPHHPLMQTCPDFSRKLREVFEKGDSIALESLLDAGCCGEPADAA